MIYSEIYIHRTGVQTVNIWLKSRTNEQVLKIFKAKILIHLPSPRVRKMYYVYLMCYSFTQPVFITVSNS